MMKAWKILGLQGIHFTTNVVLRQTQNHYCAEWGKLELFFFLKSEQYKPTLSIHIQYNA